MIVRIICLGNELVCDDGIGIRVGRVLAGLTLPRHVRVEFEPGIGLGLLDTLHSDQVLVFVDATQMGLQPGTCRLLELCELEALAGSPCCCHAIGLTGVLKIATALMPERLPARIVLVGIEAAVLDRFGTGLSDPLREALPRAVRTVLEEVLCLSAELVEQGVRRARELAHRDPDPADLPPGMGGVVS